MKKIYITPGIFVEKLDADRILDNTSMAIGDGGRDAGGARAKGFSIEADEEANSYPTRRSMWDDE